MGDVSSFRNKITVEDQDIIDIIDASSTGSIKSVSSNEGKNTLTFTRKDGSTSDISTVASLSSIVAAGGVGPTSNVTITIPADTTAVSKTFTVPYFTIDATGRVTSKANRTFTISRPAYSNYGNYASYGDYGNYSNYGNND